MKTFTISIPKPCHEDWNKMTPDEKGAFCGSCQKSVYDFSNKSDEEIISVFEKEEKGKVCGRFAPAQLTRPVISFGNVNSTNRLAVFLYALLLAFGATLFNGAEAFGQEVKGEVKVRTMGKMAMRPIITETVLENDTVIQVKQIPPTVCGTKAIVNDEIMLLGQAVVMEEPIIKTMGDTMITEIKDAVNETELFPMGEITGEIIKESILTVEPEMMIAGGVSYIEIPEVIPPTEETIEVETIIASEPSTITEDTTEVESGIVSETIILPPNELEVKVSPNPSSGQITLSYNLETLMHVRIDLFDISSKLVRTLTQQGTQYPGKYNVSYNIADLPDGIYNATLLTNDRKASAKIILAR